MDDYISVPEAAKQKGVSTAAIRLAVKSGRLHAVRFGRRAWAIKPADLAHYEPITDKKVSISLALRARWDKARKEKAE